MEYKIFSWNVNGIRASHKKGFIDFINKYKPDILCLQEIKALKEQFPQEIMELNYEINIFSAVRKGYSGVATFSSVKPNNVLKTINREEFDKEGRVLITEYEEFSLFNIYFPNGKASKERLKYKMEFYYYLIDFLKEYIQKQPNIIVCGDVNTAHKEIDLARPKENENSSGFLPEERKWIDDFLDFGFVDSLRLFNDNGENYTWWDYKTKARDRNVGWRIDYFYVSNNMKDKIKKAEIHTDVFGSDHCPISIVLDF